MIMQTTTDTPDARSLTGVALHARLEQLSAMLDEQASAQDIDQVLDAYDQEPVHKAWLFYQHVGEVMREGSQALPLPNPSFSAAVMARLQAESTGQTLVASPVPGTRSDWPRHESANDPVFRWKLLAGVASFAAVAAVLWQVVTPAVEPAAQWVQLTPSQQVQLAGTSVPAEQTVLTPQGVLVRDPQLQALLEAHRQFGGQSALQMPAGFLRNATYELPQR